MGNPGAGRPEIQINEKMFEAMIGIPFVTAENIASAMDVSVKTIRRYAKKKYGVNFDHLITQKREGHKLKLAARQYAMAMEGVPAMAIWLGKQWLGQSEKIETKNETTVTEFKIGFADEADPPKED